MARKEINILPLSDDISVTEQFGFLPKSVIRPLKSDKHDWVDAYLNDDIVETRKKHGGYDKNGDVIVQKLSEFHAGLAENIIRYWSLPGFKVVDPFAGRVTRAVVATKLNRDYYGYEITPMTYKRSLEHFNKIDINPTIYNSDGTLMVETPDEFADFVYTCPPYYNIEKYESCDGQLSDISGYDNFIDAMNICVDNVYRVLKPGAFAAFVVADFRVKGELKSFSTDLINSFKARNFRHWDTVIVETITPFMGMNAIQSSRKRYTTKIHEYVLVFRKPGEYIIPDYCSSEKIEKLNNINKFF
jgi:DNA modification methylase